MGNHSGGRRLYSLGELLAKQPKTLRADPAFSAILRLYRLSPKLQSIRISRTCRTLLDRATLNPENLPQFYRTYGLPRDPFFPLFLAARKMYGKRKQDRLIQKKEFIAAVLRGLPENVRDFMRFLVLYEKGLHSGRTHPVWSSELFPGTKKRAREYSRFDFTAWVEFFRRYLALVEEQYPVHSRARTLKFLALFILESLPEPRPPYAESREHVAKNYRRLSKLYHPDLGGDTIRFILLNQAMESIRPGGTRSS